MKLAEGDLARSSKVKSDVLSVLWMPTGVALCVVVFLMWYLVRLL
jgi:hypothetical protein